MRYEDKAKREPSGIYKGYLIDKIFLKYKFLNPILEIGCGTGEFFEKMKEHGLEGMAVDFNADTIEHCKEKCNQLGLNIEVYEKDIFNLELEHRLNTIFMFEVLEHIKDDEDALKIINDLLELNGYFLMSVPAKQGLFNAEDTFQGHLRRYEKKDILSKLDKAGLKIEIFWTYNPFPYITRFLSNRNKSDSNIDIDMEASAKNSSHLYFPTTKKLVDLFCPIYSKMQFLLKFQDFLLNSDFGAHYLILSQKK